jgi:hypothetical protein
MDNMRTEHSRMGIASFTLALIPGLLFVLLILLIPLLESLVSPEPAAPDLAPDAPGLGLLVMMLVLMTALSEITALALGIAGTLQRQRNRLFAFAGIATSVVVLVFAYVQDIIGVGFR